MRFRSRFHRFVAAALAAALAWLNVTPAAAAERIVAREGREVGVRFPAGVRLKEMPREATIPAEIAEPLLASGKTLLSPGGKVFLAVASVEKPGRFKGGRITISGGKALAVDGSEILLRPQITRSGGRRILVSVLLLPLTLLGFVKGSPARFRAGETITLEVARDSEVLVD